MSKQTLVCAPALMCDATEWHAQIAALESDVSVQVVDYSVQDSLAAMAEQLLKDAPPRFALAGHSMGGRVALEVMRIAPQRVTHLALLNTGCHALPKGEAGENESALRLGFLQLAREKGIATMARTWVRGVVHPERLADKALIDAITNMFARKPMEVYAAQIKALLDRPEAFPVLAQIRCPTLVLCGNEDVTSSPAVNREMVAAIADAQLQVVPHCGHMSLQEQPEALNAALQTWLQR